jgi:hypothetical protein
MTTTVTKTIGNGGSANGYDYGNFNDFAAAIPTDLVTADQQWIGEVYATHGEIALTATQAITGKTTDATRNIIVRAASGQGFADHANKLTNALRYNASNGAAVSCSAGVWGTAFDFSSVARVEGLQIKTTDSLVTSLKIAPGTVYGCIIDAAHSAYQNCTVYCHELLNSLVVVRAYDGYDPIIVRHQWNGAGERNSGSTIISLSSSLTAIKQEGGGMTVRGTAIFGCAAGYLEEGGWSITFTNCATDLSSLSGTGNLTSLTATDHFESMTAGSLDQRIKTGSSLIGAGVADSSYTNDLDIIEQSRSTTAPTIGAWEVASASGPTASLAITTAADVFSGSASVPASATLAITNASDAFSGSASSVTDPYIVTEPLKNNTGTVLASQTGVTAHVYEVASGNKVATLTGQTTDANGVMTISSALFSAATEYRVVVVLGSGAEGMAKYTTQ